MVGTEKRELIKTLNSLFYKRLEAEVMLANLGDQLDQLAEDQFCPYLDCSCKSNCVCLTAAKVVNSGTACEGNLQYHIEPRKCGNVAIIVSK